MDRPDAPRSSDAPDCSELERIPAIVPPLDSFLTRLGAVKENSGLLAKENSDQADRSQQLLSSYINAQASWAAQLVLDLASTKSTLDRLNPGVLNCCQGLAFVHTAKGGVLLSLATAYGFVIKKAAQDHHYGTSTWGQPLFFNVSQAGLGLSVGYQTSKSVIAVLSSASLAVFKHGTHSMGTDLGLFSTDGALMGVGGAAIGDSVHVGMAVDHKRAAFCYSKVDGLYLELSMHGSAVTPDTEANEALYGSDYDPDAVLNETQGKYASDLAPLLQVINELGHKAAQ